LLTREAIGKRQRDFAVLSAPKADLIATSFDPTINGKNFDITAELKYRENALRVLVNYTELLESLAGSRDRKLEALAIETRNITRQLLRSGASPTRAKLLEQFAALGKKIDRKKYRFIMDCARQVVEVTRETLEA